MRKKKARVVWEARLRGRDRWVRVGVTVLEEGATMSLNATLYPEKFLEARIREEK